MNTKETIIKLLLSTDRGCMDQLIDHLVEKGFFTGPASGRMHGSYVGGLADHSLAVRNKLLELTTKIDFNQKVNWGQKALKIEAENLIIAPILHDLCKIGAYVRTKADDGWTNNRDKDKGHALLSIARIEKYIVLTKLERLMILYHSGVWGLNEYDPKTGEYALTSGEKEDTKGMTKEQKVASQKRRYGKSLRNVYWHNPICYWMHVADMMAASEDKAT